MAHGRNLIIKNPPGKRTFHACQTFPGATLHFAIAMRASSTATGDLAL
jgi:hypothetical protein